MSLGERLYELRKSKNLSQEEVANRLNVTRQSVSKWETNQSTPDFDRVLPLCELYEISTDELFTGQKNDCDNNRTLKNNNKDRAFAISFSIFLYFLAVIWIIVFETVSFINDNLLIGGFLLICAFSTVNLIYKLMIIPKEGTKDIVRENKYKKLDNIISTIFLLIYLFLSFVTRAWNVTWMVWILYAIVIEIIHLVLGVVENEEK